MISTGSLLLGIALLIIVAVIVLRPVLSSSAGEATFAHAAAPVTLRQALEAQKDALLAQIRDLDFDYETGKVPEDKYRQRRANLTAEAADIFQQLDTLAPAVNGAKPAGRESGDEVVVDDEVNADDEIEAAVARRRYRSDGEEAPSSPAPPSESDEAEIEAAIARLRNRPDDGAQTANAEPAPAASPAADKRSRFCPQCGEPHDPDDKFCAYCGQRLD